MDRLTIEAPHAFAAVALSRRLEAAGAQPSVEVVDARVVVRLDVDEERLRGVLPVVQSWLVEDDVRSVRLSLHDRQFVLAA